MWENRTTEKLMVLLVLTCCCPLVAGKFTPDFKNWLIGRFGNDVARVLDREDLGDAGSFGGKATRNQVVPKNPVIFVHGVSNRAGDQPRASANYFKAHGYDWSELYGTTYANGAQGNPLQWVSYQMSCHYVKQVRAMIVAVRLYTGRAVDIVAYSLGVPITRKAILGGTCVDTRENLGKPLTRFVDTFVGVAGPNQGISLKIGALDVPGCIFAILPICNTVTGLFSGVCPAQSAFLKNINSRHGYEGRHIFSIYSKSDQLVGYQVCNMVTTKIPGQHGEKVFDRKNHDQTFYDSFEIQKQMVLNHIVA